MNRTFVYMTKLWGKIICQEKNLGMGWFLAIVHHWHHLGEPGIRDDGTEVLGEKGA